MLMFSVIALPSWSKPTRARLPAVMAVVVVVPITMRTCSLRAWAGWLTRVRATLVGVTALTTLTRSAGRGARMDDFWTRALLSPVVLMVTSPVPPVGVTVTPAPAMMRVTSRVDGAGLWGIGQSSM